MYYGLFGRCCFPRPRTCNCYPQALDQQRNLVKPCISPPVNKRPHCNKDKRCENDLIIKDAAFGGLVLPDQTEKGATYHVASLNLDTSKCKNFLVLLDFSCNIIINESRIKLRFQIVKQEKGQCFPVPISTGILFYRDRECSEANSFTLTACDYDAMISTCCNYRVHVVVEDSQAGGSVIIANPVLITTIINKE